MDPQQHRRALALLQKVYEDLARRAVEYVNENEEGLRSGGYSPFTFEELDNRFAPRLINLGHLIGALQHLQRQRPQHTEVRVERIEGPITDLDRKINERLKQSQGETLHQINFAPGENGVWHAFLTLSRQV